MTLGLIISNLIGKDKGESLPIQDEPEIFRQLVYDWDMSLLHKHDLSRYNEESTPLGDHFKPNSGVIMPL